MKVRVVDTGQYINRLRSFDFDMIVGGWGQSETPGNEQREYWSCASAERPSSRNSAGICHPVVDQLIEQLITAETREELVTLTRAMDRVLLWQHYVVPNWHLPADRILWWKKFNRPDVPLRNGVDISRWWIDDARAADLDQARADGLLTGSSPVQEGEQPWPTGWRLLLLVAVMAGGLMAIRRMMASRPAGTGDGQ